VKITIDQKSGFCFGVKKAIDLAEEEIKKNKVLYCLGDIVHNEEEVKRLEKLGLKVINRKQFFNLKDCKVLLRAHGEPPETYTFAKKNHIDIIEGTCPVVLKLQSRIKDKYASLEGVGTIVIFGKSTHPETIGLNGQIGNKAVIVEEFSDLSNIDFTKPIVLFAQTTMNKEKFQSLKKELENRMVSPELLDACDTICGQVANRAPNIIEFSKTVDAVIFVGGQKSSNSKFLYGESKKTNPNAYFVSSPEEANEINLEKFEHVGVCGATSTPLWLMEQVANSIKLKYNRNGE
jgi:4-hydroxy-3-methylbut-2-enyl diphosphate reductase